MTTTVHLTTVNMSTMTPTLKSVLLPVAAGRLPVQDRVRAGQTGSEWVRPGPDGGRTGAGRGPDRGQTGLSRAGLVQTELGQLRNNTNVSNLWSLCFRSPPPETNNSVSIQNWFTSKEGFRDHPYLKDGTTMSS